LVNKLEKVRKLWITGINTPLCPQVFTKSKGENKGSEEIYPQEKGIYPQILRLLCTSRGYTGKRIS